MAERNPVQDLLDALAPNLKDLAKELGCSHDTLRSWHTGRRFPSPEKLEQLLNLTEKHGKLLKARTKELRKVARKRR